MLHLYTVMEYLQHLVTCLGSICGRHAVSPDHDRHINVDFSYQISELEEIIQDLKEGTGEFKYLSVGVHAGKAVFNELLLEWTLYRKSLLSENKQTYDRSNSNATRYHDEAASKKTQPGGKDESIKPIVDTMNGYFSTVGVVAALILSITTPFLVQNTEFSAIVTDIWENDNDYDRVVRSQLNVVLVVMMNASQMSSLLSIITSFSLYINLNVVMVDASDKFWFVRENSSDLCELFLVFSLISLALSVPIGIYVVFGYKTAFISLGMLLVFISWILFFIFKIVLRNQARLRPKFRQAGTELDRKWVTLKTSIEKAMCNEEPGTNHENFWEVYKKKINISKEKRLIAEIEIRDFDINTVDQEDLVETFFEDDEGDCAPLQKNEMH
jgi:hypothetical protein